MSDTPRRRGRPKGTGIDDSTTLRAITSLLAANADLKPTTAIRRTGVTDPSIVRRLREKLKLDQRTPASGPKLPPLVPRRTAAASAPRPIAGFTLEPTPRLSGEPARSANPAPAPPPAPAPQPGKTLLQQPRASQDTKQQTSQPQTAPAPGPAATTASPAYSANQTVDPILAAPPQGQPQPAAPDPQLEALRLAADAAGAMSRLYLHCINHAAQTSPISLALNSQNMMTQWFSNLMAAQIAAQRKPKP